MVKVKSFNAFDIIDVVERENLPGMPGWMNLQFKVKPGLAKDDFKGAGIYAIFYKGELIYIGKFLGKKKAPFEGNVIDTRWTKHIGTLTLRSRTLSMAQKTLHRLFQENHSLILDLQSSNIKTLKRDRGNASTYNRFVFGLAHWSVFKSSLSEGLKGFEFLYVSLEPEAVSHLSVQDIRSHISSTEGKLVNEFLPKCNAVVASNKCLPPLEQQQVADRVAKSISISEEELNAAISMFKRKVNVKNKVAVQKNKEAEELSAEELFLNKLDNAPEWAKKLIEDLLSSYEGNNQVELHYKKVAGGQLRIRSFLSKRQGGLNVVTIHWKQIKNAFECLVYAPDNFCNVKGFNAVDISKIVPLNSKFEYKETNALKELLEVIEHSMSQVR